MLSERKVSWGSHLVFQTSVLFHMQMFTNRYTKTVKAGFRKFHFIYSFPF